MNRHDRRAQANALRGLAKHATGRTSMPFRVVEGDRIRSLHEKQQTYGWLAEVDRAWENGFFSVLGRDTETPIGKVTHLAVSTATSIPVKWADLQWIKDQIVGPHRCAVEFYPERWRLVDDADMYHLWVLPEGFELPFGLNVGKGPVDR